MRPINLHTMLPLLAVVLTPVLWALLWRVERWLTWAALGLLGGTIALLGPRVGVAAAIGAAVVIVLRLRRASRAPAPNYLVLGDLIGALIATVVAIALIRLF